ncbi:MAG TPA: protein kinase [Pseudonocardiaceae bacterium]|jgi:serine/threonine-protein kinase|nr:protein kinase [Pseudonocardiaceae bacterium]
MEGPLDGGYRLGDLLGRGVTGEVYAGMDAEGRELALKILRAELAGDHDLVTQLMRECVVLARVRHPNLVGVHECLVDGAVVAIVLDKVGGGSLRAHQHEAGTLLPAEVARIGAGIAAALAAIHKVGLLHLNLTPNNILLDDSTAPRTPRLADFGTFALLSASAGGRSVPINRSPRYAAPELLTEAPATAASDQYSLGIVLYELCCGVVPFGGGTDYAVMRHQVRSAPKRPEGIPDQLWALIDRLLAKDPADRIGPAQRVSELLEAMVGELVNHPCAVRLTSPPESTPIAPTPPTSGAPTSGAATESAGFFGPTGDFVGPIPVGGPVPKRRRRAVLVGVGAALLVAIGILAGVAFAGSGNSSGNAAAPANPGETNQSSATAQQPTSSTVPPMTVAPNLVGLSLANAQDSLPSSVNVTTVDTIDASAADGTVLTQDPAAGAPLNGTMQLTVARQPVTVYLDSLTPAANAYNWENQQSGQLSGKTYTNALRANLGNCDSPDYVDYNVEKGYRQFTATAGIDDNSADPSTTATLQIFTDGRLAWTTTVAFGSVYPIKIDLSGILRLRIEWQTIAGSNGDCGDNDDLVLGSAALLGLPGEVPSASTSATPTN